MKLSPRVVAVACLICLAVGVVVLVYFDPALIYRWTHDGWSMHRALRRQIKNGDLRAHVDRLLGPGTIYHDQAKMAGVCRMQAQQWPEIYAEGVRDNDVFYVWRPLSGGPILQFRDDKLVNHIPEDFRVYSEPSVIR